MKRLLYIFWMWFAVQNILAFQPADSTVTVEIEEPTKSSLYVGVGYGSDLLYSGYSLSGQKPYYSTDVLYSFNSDWSASAAIYNLDGKAPTVAFFDVALGFHRYFNSWLDAGASISAYFTHSSIQDTYFGNFAYLTVSGGLDWRILYSRLVYSALLDDSGSHYLQLKNSHYFSTNNFCKDKAYMDFNPTFNLVFGNSYELVTTSQSKSPGQGSSNEEVIAYESSFGLMDLELSVPISFNYENISLEIEPMYYIPIFEDPDFPAEKGLFFFVNMYYRIL